MTTFLFVGDMHIRSGDHLDDIERCMDFAAGVAHQYDVDAVIQVGDVFEKSSSPAERLVFAEWLKKLHPIPVYITRGNHDARNDLSVFDGFPGVSVYQEPAIVGIDDVDVMMLPWPEKAFLAARGITGEAGSQVGSNALNDLIQLTAATRESSRRPFLIAGHLTVGGAVMSSGQPLIGQHLEASLQSLEESGAEFVCLGHIHKPQEMGQRTRYIGSISGHDFGECDEEKRIVVVEVGGVDETTWISIPVPARRWETIEATVEDQGILEMRGDIDTLHDTADQPWCQDWNIRYRYHCTAEQARLFDHSEIERRFAVAHTLKIVPDIERTERVRAAEVAEAKTPAEKLRAWGYATETEIPESAVEKLGELQEAI